MNKEVSINTDFITLGQFLKYAGIVQNGGQSKAFLLENEAKINEIVDQRRGKKLYNGDKIEINGKKYVICSK